MFSLYYMCGSVVSSGVLMEAQMIFLQVPGGAECLSMFYSVAAEGELTGQTHDPSSPPLPALYM